MKEPLSYTSKLGLATVLSIAVTLKVLSLDKDDVVYREEPPTLKSKTIQTPISLVVKNLLGVSTVHAQTISTTEKKDGVFNKFITYLANLLTPSYAKFSAPTPAKAQAGAAVIEYTPPPVYKEEETPTPTVLAQVYTGETYTPPTTVVVPTPTPYIPAPATQLPFDPNLYISRQEFGITLSKIQDSFMRQREGSTDAFNRSFRSTLRKAAVDTETFTASLTALSSGLTTLTSTVTSLASTVSGLSSASLSTTTLNSLDPIQVGNGNTASCTDASAVGYSNTASGCYSSAFGYNSNATAYVSSAFGQNNTASGSFSSAFGHNNTSSGYISSAFGAANTSSAVYSTAIGACNIASGSGSSVFGLCNTASALNSVAVGRSNFTGTGGIASVQIGILNNSTGGTLNSTTGVITGTPVACTTIGRMSSSFGICNITSGCFTSASGYNNIVSGFASSAFGHKNCSTGGSTTASGYYNTASNFSSSAFGVYNVASGERSSAIGKENTSSGLFSSASGYRNVTSGVGSSAFGYFNTASAINSSAFGSNLSNDRACTTRIGHSTSWASVGLNADSKLIDTSSGAHLTTGGSWTNSSSKEKKENYTALDKAEMLEKIKLLNIERWNYKTEDPNNTHIGPYAEDFYELFNTGNDSKAISTIDSAGVALIGVQALAERLDTVVSTIGGGIASTAGAITATFDKIISREAEIEVVNADQINATNINAKENICIDGVCIDKDKLMKILDNIGEDYENEDDEDNEEDENDSVDNDSHNTDSADLISTTTETVTDEPAVADPADDAPTEVTPTEESAPEPEPEPTEPSDEPIEGDTNPDAL